MRLRRSLGAVSSRMLGQAVIVFVVVAVGVIASVSLARLVDLAEGQKVTSEQSVEARRILLAQGRLLVECTTAPEQRHPPVRPKNLQADDCYVRQQAHTKELIAGLIADNRQITRAAAAAAAVCIKADPSDTPSEVEACVRRRLTSQH